MTIAIILFCVLFCILAAVLVVLNRKNTEWQNTAEEEIRKNTSNCSGLQQRCDTIERNLSATNTATSEKLADLGRSAIKIHEYAKNTNAELSKKIAALQKDTDSLTEGKAALEKRISSLTEDRDALEEKIGSLTEDRAALEERLGSLTSILASLNAENRQLREELADQKKKLNFYLNIEDAAETLNVTEDAEERERLIALAAQQVVASRTGSFPEEQKSPEEEKPTAPKPVNSSPAVGDSEGQNLPIPEESEAGEEEADSGFSLDAEQRLASSYMDTTMENVFVTGKAGTGKSFLLDVFRNSTEKSHVVLAPTGIAALKVNGATLHSMFGYFNLVNLDIDSISDATIKLKDEKRSVLRKVSTIIIDEISMVRADTFDKIDRILKVLNRNEKPFGGKQMLVFGDLFQIPPIAKKQEHQYLADRYGGIYFFHSDAYKAGNFKFIELTKNHRQKSDKRYFEVLNRIREGQTTDEDIRLLNTRFTPNEDIYADRFISLFPKKAEAERVNREHINLLESKEYVYRAKILLDERQKKENDFDSSFPIVNELSLRLGASVMMVANDPEHRWVNGTVGIVEKLAEDSIFVSFGRGKTYEIHPMEFDEQEITYVDGKIAYKKVFSVLQYPLVPAYAITIHKSQGQTYGNIACDIENCFTSGQAYVALSRCVSLNGLHLKSRITPASIKVNHDVLAFYREQLSNNLLKK